MSQLENLEAKMANIEVSLSSSNPVRKRKGTSLNGTVSRSSSRFDPKGIGSTLQERENVIQNIRVQFGLGKLEQTYLVPLKDSDRLQAEQNLKRLKMDAENKRIAIRNLRSALNKLDITDNIDIRIRQAELEYALGREELQLLSLVEEARVLQVRLDKLKPEANTLYSHIQSGVSLSLHAVQATVGRWDANAKVNSPGIYVEWALDGEGLNRGDRILEVNGKISTYKTRDELHKAIGTTGKCLLVVIRKQQMIQQEDNRRLQHRISYLEEQVMELQASKEAHNNAIANGVSDHITSINISLPESSEKLQRAKYVTMVKNEKPIELKTLSPRTHVTKTHIKENGCDTDTGDIYRSSITSLSASKISVNSDFMSHLKIERASRDCFVDQNLSMNRQRYLQARSVEHLNYKGFDRRQDIQNGDHVRKLSNEVGIIKKKSEFENRLNDRKHIVDYTSEPMAPQKRPTPPKKPLRLSLQRAQSLQTVEINQQNEVDHRKRVLKRSHISAAMQKQRDQYITTAAFSGKK